MTIRTDSQTDRTPITCTSAVDADDDQAEEAGQRAKKDERNAATVNTAPRSGLHKLAMSAGRDRRCLASESDQRGVLQADQQGQDRACLP